MIASSKTKLCISIASNPGDFGMKFHNASYKFLNLDWVYIARKVNDINELKNVFSGIRALNIRGCSVSMPHKEKVIEFLDDIDPPAKKIGAINTITNKDNELKGYNTDFYGAKKVLEKINLKGKNVVLIGAGGVAKSVGQAVKDLGGVLTIANRTYERSEKLSRKIKAKTIDFGHLKNSSGDLLINATPVGMRNINEMIVEKEVLKNFNTIMDLVIYPAKTKLLRISSELNKKIIPGTLVCVYQAAEQFKIYTGKDAPKKIIKNTLMKLSK